VSEFAVKTLNATSLVSDFSDTVYHSSYFVPRFGQYPRNHLSLNYYVRAIRRRIKLLVGAVFNIQV